MYKAKFSNYYTEIDKIPYNLSLLNNANINNKIKIVGYKQIHYKIYVPIVELENFTRIWLLINEIK